MNRNNDNRNDRYEGRDNSRRDDRNSSSDRPYRSKSSDRYEGRDSSRRDDRNSSSDRPYRSKSNDRYEGRDSSRRDDRNSSSDRPYRSKSNDRYEGRDNSRRDDRNSSSDRPYRSKSNDRYEGRDNSRRDDRNSSSDRPYRSNDRYEGRNNSRRDDRNSSSDRPYRSNDRYEGRDNSRRDDRNSSSDRPYRSNDRYEGRNNSGRDDRNSSSDRPYRPKSNDRYEGRDNSRRDDRNSSSDRPYRSNDRYEGRDNSNRERSDRGFKTRSNDRFRGKDAARKRDNKGKPSSEDSAPREGIRINKFLADSGLGSRRDVETYITTGAVKVNGEIMINLGYRVLPTDKVEFDGRMLSGERKRYFALNKPKDFITTSRDDKGRRTVLDLMRKACKERIYPVGRLDKDTTGVLLFTNDGHLTKTLLHPKYGAQKLYHVTVHKPIVASDMERFRNGLDLEDGFFRPDEIESVEGSKNEVGIRIHSGKNRIVRRYMEQLGYRVVKLDRVLFAGVSKKLLKRGDYRELSPREVAQLNSFMNNA